MEYGLVVVWLATYLLLGLVSFPFAAALFSRFADDGAAMTVPLAIATIAIVAFLVGHFAFGWVALIAGTAALAGISVLLSSRVEFARRAFIEPAVVFTIAFLLLVAVRAVDPAIAPLPLAIGEKFLDMGLIQALLRADTLPPEDMWFAGESVRYYYGGHMIAALLARLTFTPARFAYNLSLAGFYAMYVTAAYGLAANVAASQGGPRRLAGGLAAFFVGLGSNLYIPGKVVVWLLPGGLARLLAEATGLGESVVEWSPTGFWYFRASRVIDGTITEFPLFAWLNGDHHAHMVTPPFLLLAGAVLFAYWQTPARERIRRWLLLFGVVPPIGGLVAVANTWTFPSVAFGLPVLVIALAPAPARSLFPAGLRETLPVADKLTLRDETLRVGYAVALAAVVAALSYAWSFPYWAVSPDNSGVALFPSRSALGPLLIVHGIFLAVFVAFFLRRIEGTLERPWLVAVAVLAVAVAAVSVDIAALALFLPLLITGWILLRLRRDVGYETVLILGGLGLALAVEFVYVVERAGPERFNTVFKTYTQVWALFAPATGVALARLVDGSRLPSPRSDEWRTIGRVLAVVLVFTSGLYAGFALPSHFGNEQGMASLENPTLDGTAYVAQQYPGEAEAIAWLADRRGTPTIVSVPGCYRPDRCIRPYQWVNAPSSLTGLPTIAGWTHAADYHNQTAFDRRVEDVHRIYTGQPSTQRALLRKYNVGYIYVGPNEREVFGNEISIERVEAASVAHQSGQVTVYRVDPSAL